MASPGTNTTDSNDKKNFLDLPAELRNQVYGYVAQDESSSVMNISFSRCRYSRTGRETGSNLLHASTQTRSEYMPILYQQHGIHLELGPAGRPHPPRLEKWLDIFATNALQHSKKLVFLHDAALGGTELQILLTPAHDKGVETEFRFEITRRIRRVGQPIYGIHLRPYPSQIDRQAVLEQVVKGIIQKEMLGAERPTLSKSAVVEIIKVLRAI